MHRRLLSTRKRTTVKTLNAIMQQTQEFLLLVHYCKSEIFAILLFSRIALKDILDT